MTESPMEPISTMTPWSYFLHWHLWLPLCPLVPFLLYIFSVNILHVCFLWQVFQSLTWLFLDYLPKQGLVVPLSSWKKAAFRVYTLLSAPLPPLSLRQNELKGLFSDFSVWERFPRDTRHTRVSKKTLEKASIITNIRDLRVEVFNLVSHSDDGSTWTGFLPPSCTQSVWAAKLFQGVHQNVFRLVGGCPTTIVEYFNRSNRNQTLVKQCLQSS